MAPTEKCSSCQQAMYARNEKFMPAGTEVLYECQNYNCPQYVKSGRRYHPQLKRFVDNRR